MLAGDGLMDKGGEQENQSGDEPHPVQFAQANADYIAGKFCRWQNSKHRRRQHEREKDNAADPCDQRQQHQPPQSQSDPAHTGTGML